MRCVSIAAFLEKHHASYPRRPTHPTRGGATKSDSYRLTVIISTLRAGTRAPHETAGRRRRVYGVWGGGRGRRRPARNTLRVLRKRFTARNRLSARWKRAPDVMNAGSGRRRRRRGRVSNPPKTARGHARTPAAAATRTPRITHVYTRTAAARLPRDSVVYYGLSCSVVSSCRRGTSESCVTFRTDAIKPRDPRGVSPPSVRPPTVFYGGICIVLQHSAPDTPTV